MIDSLKHMKNIAVLGYGMEGQSTVRYLLGHGIEPDQLVVLDKKTDLTVPT